MPLAHLGHLRSQLLDDPLALGDLGLQSVSIKLLRHQPVDLSLPLLGFLLRSLFGQGCLLELLVLDRKLALQLIKLCLVAISNDLDLALELGNASLTVLNELLLGVHGLYPLAYGLLLDHDLLSQLR